MMKKICFIVILLFYFPLISYAKIIDNSNFPQNIGQSVVLVSYSDGNVLAFDNSNDLKQYRLSLTFSPYQLYYKLLSLGLDGSFNYLTSDQASIQNSNDHLYLVALSPVLRLFVTRNKSLLPYIEGGVGPSYLSNNNFDDRALGSRFAFQDFLSLGLLTTSSSYPFEASVRIIHYSNAGFHHDNRGITMPIVFNIGIRF